ncbi:MAG: hypothetical protein LBB05_01730 [Puniceicoccales bacterium]|nr:hypothetical protein [Puniceicoccales bacterium]
MSEINNNSFRNLHEELTKLQETVSTLRANAKKNKSAQVGTYTVNGITYNVQVSKPPMLFGAEKVIITAKLADREVILCQEEDLSESKLKHVILKHQWKNKGKLSLERQGQLYAEAAGHGIGKDKIIASKTVDPKAFAEQCLEIARDKGESATKRADALLGLCAAYGSLDIAGKQASYYVTSFFIERENPIQTIADGLFDAIKNSSLSKEEREKAGELLAKMYNNPEITKTTRNHICEQIQTVANGLFEAVKDPNSSEADREKAGELLAKMYNNPQIPEATRKHIHGQVHAMAHEICVNAAVCRFGLPKSVIEEMLPENGIAAFSLESNEARKKGEVNTVTTESYDLVTEGNIELGEGGMLKYKYATVSPEKQAENSAVSCVFLPMGEGILEYDQEQGKLVGEFHSPGITFDTKMKGMASLLSMYNKNFNSEIGYKPEMAFGDAFSRQLGKLGFGKGEKTAIGRAVYANRLLKEETEKQLRKMVETIIQEHLKNPNGNAFSDDQKDNIVKAWSIVTKEQKSFEEIIAQFQR